MKALNPEYSVGCVAGYQVIQVIRIFAKTYSFEYQIGKSVTGFLFHIRSSIRKYLGVRLRNRQFQYLF